MKLIVGLGNPGKKYEKMRHNVGFILLDKIASEKGLKFKLEKKFNAEIAKDGEVIYAKPQTFMNNSGEAVSKLVSFYSILPEDLVLVHDEVDISFGEVKKQFDRGSAGHRGVESIIEKLGTSAFWRFRVGVGKDPAGKIPTDEWVLMNLSKTELQSLAKIDLNNL